jgi:hypothetical protein
MATTKKVVPLPAKKKPPEPQPQDAEKEFFRDQTDYLCRHVAAQRDLEDLDALYESTTMLVRQIGALFSGIYELEGGSGEGRILVLCCLGEDLVQEIQRRVNAVHDFAYSLAPKPEAAKKDE